MKLLTVRGSHQTCINAYTCITWGKLYINQKQLPRDWSWYDDITNKFDLGRRLNKMELTIIDNFNWSLQKGLVFNNNLASLGQCWSLSVDLFFAYPLFCNRILVCVVIFVHHFRYEQLCSSLDQGFLLLGYLSPDVYPWSSNLTLNTTKPVGYQWYTSIFLFCGLTRISLSLLLMKV